jgi:hypothetical protein
MHGQRFARAFKLSKAGETIAPFAPNGILVDSVNYGVQTNNVSQGRWPDGSRLHFSPPRPRAPNLNQARRQRFSLSGKLERKWVDHRLAD